MQRRVTIIDIAARCGFHFTTVSAALKDDPRIKFSTRTHIRSVAKDMGYVPDPALSALSAYRTAKKPINYQETLGWITSHPSASGWRQGAFQIYYEGALKRATELGYRLEEIWIKEGGMSSQRISKVLSSRGVRGLLIAPLPASRGHLNLEWERFVSVTFGFTLTRPRLLTVAPTHFQDVITAVRYLKSLGHRRLGWANDLKGDERVGRQSKAGFLSELMTIPLSQQIPLFSQYPFEQKAFLAWFKRYRPEAIVTTGPHSCGRRILEWLNDAGFAVPEHVSIAVLGIQEEGIFSGIKEPSCQIGETSVDLLVGLLHNGRRGVPEYPSRLLIEGKWIDGQTVARPPRR